MNAQSSPAYAAVFGAVHERELREWVLPAARRREAARVRRVSDRPDLRNELVGGPLEPPNGDLADDLGRELCARWNVEVMGRMGQDPAQAPVQAPVAGTERQRW